MSVRKSKRVKKALTWFKLGLLAVLALGAASLFTPYPAELVRALNPPPPAPNPTTKPKPKATSKPKPKVDKATQRKAQFVLANPRPWSPESAFSMPTINLPNFPPALPESVEPGNYEHVNTLTRGLNNRSNVNFRAGSTAAQDRVKSDAYSVRVSLDVLLPRASQGEELLKANPELSKVLPRFADIMGAAKVSPWYHSLYLHKQNRIRKNTAMLTQLLDRHNFFDTDTILEIDAPDTGRRVLWIQADMDVVSDGSDGDRLPTMPEKICKSDYYQPTTSYRWKKLTKTPNPLLAGWKERQTRYRKQGKKDEAANATRVIFELENSSFLLAEYDSFIVAPLTLKEGKNDTYRPSPGDYAAVVVGKRVFPAIVGDFGPRFKTGEASLRLCKAVNSKATTYARAVSDLGVSYIIFPGSKEPENGPIDYERLNVRVRELLDEMGGLSPEAEFVEMKDLLPQPGAKQQTQKQ